MNRENVLILIDTILNYCVTYNDVVEAVESFCSVNGILIEDGDLIE